MRLRYMGARNRNPAPYATPIEQRRRDQTILHEQQRCAVDAISTKITPFRS